MNDETKQFEIKDNVQVEGITEDYVWYHSEVLITHMRSWESQFKRLAGVMESRHKEHLVMIDKLMRENSILKFEITRLKEKGE